MQDHPDTAGRNPCTIAAVCDWHTAPMCSMHCLPSVKLTNSTVWLLSCVDEVTMLYGNSSCWRAVIVAVMALALGYKMANESLFYD